VVITSEADHRGCRRPGRAPNQLLKTQRGSTENEWRRQMHADTSWHCWTPKEKFGDFQLHKGWSDGFLSSAVALRKQNRNQKRKVAYRWGGGGGIHIQAGKEEIRGMQFCFHAII
jgi:hypothetical protein